MNDDILLLNSEVYNFRNCCDLIAEIILLYYHHFSFKMNFPNPKPCQYFSSSHIKTFIGCELNVSINYSLLAIEFDNFSYV